MAGIFILFSILLKISVINCDDVIKSSLTFVIDDTGSMGDDIRQVIESSNNIFDAVMEAEKSQIENFILVTFNDPDVRDPTITRDRNVFKQALNNIVVSGGGDCPEYSMSGIERALEESLPRSFLYVFTDASPKDHNKYEQVKRLAQKKSSQVVFVLTGVCGDGKHGVYYNIADATMGQVFELGKTDVNVILDFVVETIKGSNTVLTKTKLPPGYDHTVNYTVDDHIKKDVLISATGDKPRITEVSGPDGSKPDTEKLADVGNTAIVKVSVDAPGVYTAKVGSKSDTRVLITGKTTIDFQHGFSTFKPTSIKDTASRPQRDVKSYLSIKLNIVEGGDVNLTRVRIEDADGKTLFDEPLELINVKDRLYMTNPIATPNKMFRIVVIGFVVADNSSVTRMSPTLVEPQAPELEIIKPRAPKVTIEGGPKVSKGYNESTKISCKVNGYPSPDIIWVEESTGFLLPTTIESVEPPYEYISILDLQEVKKNITYTCKATNTLGKDAKNIAIEIPMYFIVKQTPKDAVVKYDTEGVFVCKIDASPPAHIVWLKNGNEITTDKDIRISDDGSELTIPKMDIHLQGHYVCDARNNVKRKMFNFEVAISGVEKPAIDKTANKIYVAKGSDPNLLCKVTNGVPPPTFRWYYRSNLKEQFRPLRGFIENTINFKNITTVNAGVYKCIVRNELGTDRHKIELIVEYPPIIKAISKTVSDKAGKEVTLICEVDGIPSPIVQWTKNGVVIENTPSTPIYRDHSLKLKLSVENSGIYKCTAANHLGRVTNETKVEVYVPPYIQPPKESPLQVKVGEDVSLLCDAEGVPTPQLKWVFHDKYGRRLMMESESNVLSLPRAQLPHTGYYTCMATNVGGTYNITYDVTVQAPPIIENIYKDRVFRPVVGDTSLMIKCNATGHPKPVVTWTKDGFNIAAGTPWNEINEFGTLYIKNIDRKSDGTYVCRAENILGQDTEVYSVNSEPYPAHASRISNLLIEKGTTVAVQCDVPHDIVDSIRWYKNDVLILHGELTINNAQLSDSGLYACRVSNLMKSESGFTKISVGSKPKFVSSEEENIELEEGNVAQLICDTDAEPPATTTWWHNGVVVNVTEPYHIFYMKISDHGNHTCEASNEFGKVQRTFRIQTKDCMLNVKDDFMEMQPIMYSHPLETWPSYEVVDGNMIIPKDYYVYLTCPDSFTNPRLSSSPIAMAFCVGEKTFKIKGTYYEYSKIKCNSKVIPSINTTDEECFGTGTKLFHVNIKVQNSYIRAYDICYDVDNYMPVYTKHSVDRHLADDEPTSVSWLNLSEGPGDLDYLYDCNDQVAEISDVLERPFHSEDKCCFKKRLLVNPRDIVPGVLQSSAYTNINVVPQWSTCNKNNWDNLEQRIRNLAKSVGHPLTVWTGIYEQLKLPKNLSEMKPITINDLPVPRYLWKVVQDPVAHTSLAIIQVNVPDLERSEVEKHVLCKDVCQEIPWLRSEEWHIVSQGYIYCCRLRDFKKVFGFKHVIDRDYNRLLTKAISEASYTLI